MHDLVNPVGIHPFSIRVEVGARNIHEPQLTGAARPTVLFDLEGTDAAEAIKINRRFRKILTLLKHMVYPTMNHMGKPRDQALEPAMKLFADVVGDFIRYWGFRRIHGQIWAYVYLSKDSLSGNDLARLIGVSKGLISPALRELEHHQLIQALPTDRKTRRYVANSEILAVIRQVLKERELKLIESARGRLEQLKATSAHPDSLPIDLDRVANVDSLIHSAESLLSILVAETPPDADFRSPSVSE